jgi:hypothetical protein
VALSAVAVTDSGLIAVADRHSHDVRVYDRTGALVRRIGGPGDGPGELSGPRSVALWHDTIYVLDNRALNVFAPGGGFVERRQLTTPGQRGAYVQRVWPTRDGLVGVSAIPADFERAINAGPARGAYEIFALDPTKIGSVGPLLASFPTHDMYKRGYMEASPFMSEGPAFSVALNGRVFWTNIDGYDLEIASPSDSSRQRLRFATTPKPASSAEIESRLQVLDRSTDAARKIDPNMPTRGKARRALLSLPRLKFLPVIGRILVAADGDVMIERNDLGAGGARRPGKTAWDLVDDRGAITGRVELPSLLAPEWTDSRTIVGIEVDSMDTQTVVRYRIKRPTTAAVRR